MVMNGWSWLVSVSSTSNRSSPTTACSCPPLLVQGSAEIPDFDFDLDEGYVLTIYCIGEATLDVRIDGEPADAGAFACENGQMTMARNAPDITPDESNIVVDVDSDDSYWLAAVTRSPEQHRAD